ncbi:calmodulin-binding receptor-like cytoplasmic kinase 3 [Quercus suber]|uniref:non-specific serine/threonine protein kinase n=1 Tax=Quercus suber TaxID=58331 RepID=A0AAW0K2D0_QUESU
MEIKFIILLRMDIIVLSLLLLVQLPRIFASEFVQSKVCGTDNIAYSNSNGHELFYINGDAVNEDLFCEALQFYHASGCIFDGYLGSNHCEVDLSLDGLVFKAGRKLFQRNLKEQSKFHGRHRHHMSTPTIAGMATTGAFVLCCVFLCACFQKRKKPTSHTVLSKDPHSIDSASSFDVNPAPEKIPASPHRMPIPPSPSRFSISPKLKGIGSLQLTLSQLSKATSNFSPSLRIGEGGFGTVYKAQLENGHMVAIKRAKKELFENLQTEFSSEVELLAKIDHRNLVKLLGYIDQGNERLIIIEYVPNGTLREHLDGQRGRILDFNQRLEIAIDAFKKYDEGSVEELMDPLMEEVVDAEVLMKMFSLAFLCAAPVRVDRPDMKSVGEQLWAIRADYLKSAKKGP